jgi:hypothetical protein
MALAKRHSYSTRVFKLNRAIQSWPFGLHLRPFEFCFDFDFDVGSLGPGTVNSEMGGQL